MYLFFLTLIFYILGSSFCFFLHFNFGLHSLTSMILTGFLGSFLYVPLDKEKSFIHGVVYAGAFAGACSPEIIENWQHLFILSFIGSVVFYFSISFLLGFGGRLGVISFISSLIFFLIKTVW